MACAHGVETCAAPDPGPWCVDCTLESWQEVGPNALKALRLKDERIAHLEKMLRDVERLGCPHHKINNPRREWGCPDCMREVRMALRKYGRHMPLCARASIFGASARPKRRCTCGFDDVAEPIETDGEEK